MQGLDPDKITLTRFHYQDYRSCTSTKISYSLPTDSKVTLDVFNIAGIKVGQLVNKDQSAGFYSVEFNSSTLGRDLSSGVYFYRIHAVDNLTGRDFSSVKKMILMK